MLDLVNYERKRVLLPVALACIVSVVGCNKGPTMVQVQGKVAYKDGSALRGGVRVVRFEPSKDSTAEVRRLASGEIEKDGSFKLFTRRPGDGVFPGKYNVTFTVWKGSHEPTSFILDKYTTSATTPYHVTIDRDQDDLKFELEPTPAAVGHQPATTESPGNGTQ